MDTQTTESSRPEPTGVPVPPPQPTASTEPAKRRRGRPFGSKNALPPLGEQPISGESAQPQEAPRKRKRRAAQIDTDKLRKQIAGLHQLASKAVYHLSGDQDLANIYILDDTECAMLADGYAQVAREYDIEIFGGKTGALLQLLGAAVMVYGPRVLILRAYAESNTRRRRDPVTVEGEAAATAAANGSASAH